jgi:hypothetical protein
MWELLDDYKGIPPELARRKHLIKVRGLSISIRIDWLCQSCMIFGNPAGGTKTGDSAWSDLSGEKI